MSLAEWTSFSVKLACWVAVQVIMGSMKQLEAAEERKRLDRLISNRVGMKCGAVAR